MRNLIRKALRGLSLECSKGTHSCPGGSCQCWCHKIG